MSIRDELHAWIGKAKKDIESGRTLSVEVCRSLIDTADEISKHCPQRGEPWIFYLAKKMVDEGYGLDYLAGYDLVRVAERYYQESAGVYQDLYMIYQEVPNEEPLWWWTTGEGHFINGPVPADRPLWIDHGELLTREQLAREIGRIPKGITFHVVLAGRHRAAAYPGGNQQSP